jgi:phytoene dehydrogenase-like protein
MSGAHDAVVIGAGHNGLACACYLARAGLRVLVLEQAERVGGMTLTEEVTLPGFWSDLHASGWQLANLSPVPRELELDGRYQLIEPALPFSHAFPARTSSEPGHAGAGRRPARAPRDPHRRARHEDPGRPRARRRRAARGRRGARGRALRPIPELGGYRTPVPNVYLCGSGSHPGPGVSMAPGRNAARVILADLDASIEEVVTRPRRAR